MAKSKRMMETDEKTGVQRQFFPITHISAVIGLEKIISGQSKVLSVNGKIGAVVITKEDLGLGNVITELPYANEMQDGIITAEMYQKILNSGAGDYVLPIAGILPTASAEEKGGIKIGNRLSIDEDGTLSADPQFNYTAGANISISNTGAISATGSGEGGGVSQEYVDQKASEAYQNAKAYADSKIPSMTFEKVGEV